MLNNIKREDNPQQHERKKWALDFTLESKSVSTQVGKTLYRSINYLTSFSFSEFLPAFLILGPHPAAHRERLGAAAELGEASPLLRGIGRENAGRGRAGRGLHRTGCGAIPALCFASPGPPIFRAALARLASPRPFPHLLCPGQAGPAAAPPGAAEALRRRGRRAEPGSPERGRRTAAPTAPPGAGLAAQGKPRAGPPRSAETRAGRAALSLPWAGAAPVPRTRSVLVTASRVCDPLRGRGGWESSRCATRTPAAAKKKNKPKENSLSFAVAICKRPLPPSPSCRAPGSLSPGPNAQRQRRCGCRLRSGPAPDETQVMTQPSRCVAAAPGSALLLSATLETDGCKPASLSSCLFASPPPPPRFSF